MEYNEYKAPAGKVLFNTDNFTYGHTMLSAFNLNLIVLDEAEAERLSSEYQAKEKEVQEAEINKEEVKEETVVKPSPLKARGMVSTMSMNEDGVYEETEEVNSLEDFKRNHIASLLAKGVSFNLEGITLIKHNTENI